MPSTPKSRSSAGGPHNSPRATSIAPMSERQQMALVMQMTSQNLPSTSTNPGEERRKNRQHRNVRGETPLHVAAIKGDHELVKKLLDQGQDPNVADFAGWTPLHEACNYAWSQVVSVLVKAGANVNAKGLEDDTPLHDAVTTGNLKLVKFLIDHGADPFMKNDKGQTPSDFAAPHIFNFLQSLKENNSRAAHSNRARDDNSKKASNVSSSSAEAKRNSMDSLAQGEFSNKDITATSTSDKNTASISDSKQDGHVQLSCAIVSSSQDDTTIVVGKRAHFDSDTTEADCIEDEGSKKKKRKDHDSEKEIMGRPAPVSRGPTGRVLTGTKPPGPASKTGAAPLKGGGQNQHKSSSSSASSKSNIASQGKGSSGSSNKSFSSSGSHHQSKSFSGGKTGFKQDRKSPVASPKAHSSKDMSYDDEETRAPEHAPKVPPLKIVIPGGASSSGNQQDGDGGSGQRGSGKGRNSSSTLPYVIPCTSSDSLEADEVERKGEGKSGQRVLRSHRATDGDKERISPHTQAGGGSGHSALSSNKSPQPSTSHAGSSSQDNDHHHHHGSSGGKGEGHWSGHHHPPVELHPRKRKIKSSKEHSRESKSSHDDRHESTSSHISVHSNPYQMYLHIRKQIDERQRSLFPVKPKPPKDFNKYLMNRCTYTLQKNVNLDPIFDIPVTLPMQMKEEFITQERERHQLRIQHLVEKEKLVLAVEQEILRVHGRAERAAANQAMPYSVCTMLRNREVYNVLPAPEPDDKKNAQRSRFTIRQINSWLQEVDDKWEKIKEGMLQRQHTEAETLHAVQKMSWEWKLKDLGLCDFKTFPKIDPSHVPQVHVSNFDLRA